MCHPEVPAGTPLPEVRTREIAIEVAPGESLPGLYALPQRPSAPAVLVVNDVFGRSDFYEHLTGRIAQAGFVALDVEFFFREGPVPAGDRPAAQARRARLDQERALRDLDAAIAWLQAQPEARGARMGTVGFCMGGTFVLQLAARRAHLATVCYYGFPAVGGGPGEPARPLDIADRMTGPILGHWGDEDHGVGMDNVRALDETLTASGIDHTFHVYPGLGHGFLKGLADESAPLHDLACESWTRTLDFWRTELMREG